MLKSNFKWVNIKTQNQIKQSSDLNLTVEIVNVTNQLQDTWPNYVISPNLAITECYQINHNQIQQKLLREGLLLTLE